MGAAKERKSTSQGFPTLGSILRTLRTEEWQFRTFFYLRQLSQEVGQHSKLVRETKHTANNPRKPNSPPSCQVGPEVDLSQALDIRTHGTLGEDAGRKEGGQGLGPASGRIPTLSITSHLPLPLPELTVLNWSTHPHTGLHS